MNVGKTYTIRLMGDPEEAMHPLPFDYSGPSCMKNKCMKVKKSLQPRHEFDHDYMVDILNKLDGSMNMPNVKIMSNMFEPRLLSKKFKINLKSKKGKKKKGKKGKKGKSLSRTLSLPDLLSGNIMPFKLKSNAMSSSNSIQDIIEKELGIKLTKKKKTNRKKNKKKTKKKNTRKKSSKQSRKNNKRSNKTKKNKKKNNKTK